MKGVLHVSRWKPKLEGQPHKLPKLARSCSPKAFRRRSIVRVELGELAVLQVVPRATAINYVKHFIKHPQSSG
jgi:hypothetical protein